MVPGGIPTLDGMDPITLPTLQPAADGSIPDGPWAASDLIDLIGASVDQVTAATDIAGKLTAARTCADASQLLLRHLATQAYRDGADTRDIAALLGVTPVTVAMWRTNTIRRRRRSTDDDA